MQLSGNVLQCTLVLCVLLSCRAYVIQLCKCLALNTSLAICTLWPDSNHSFLPVPCVLLVLIQRSRLPNYIKAAG